MVRVVGASHDRPNQIGLGFEAAKHKRDRIDNEGTVWIDTVARALLDIEFKYVGLDRNLERLNPGGHMEFREMPNGAVLLHRWNLRLVGAEANLVLTRDGFPYTTSTPYVQDGGGEIARVTWPDGKTWRAPLGTPSGLHATKAGRIIGTNADRFREHRLPRHDRFRGQCGDPERLPGDVPDHDPRPAVMPALSQSTGEMYTAVRDSVETTGIVVATAEDAVRDQCVERQHTQPGEKPWLLVRVLTADGQPVAGISLNVRIETPSQDWVRLRDEGRTGADGLMAFCGGLKSPANVVVEARRKSERIDTPVHVNGDLVVARITFPKQP